MPVVTLSTDTGNNDFIAGAIKGQLISAVPDVVIADISHDLDADNYMHAAYVCNAAFAHYPAGTFHFIVINLFQQTPSFFLFAEYNDQFIICPDNGILTVITGNKPENVLAIDIKSIPGKSLTTLNCTAAFALFLKKINEGSRPENFCRPAAGFDEKLPLRPTTGPDWIDAQIIFIDNFNNVVLNITRDEFEAHRNGRLFTIALPTYNNKEGIADIVTHYTSVKQGSTLAWFNSAGYLELAINKGNIADMFGLQLYNHKEKNRNKILMKKLMYQRVKIYFEEPI